MNFKLWLAPALLCGAMLAGCIDDIPGVDAKEKYTRDFVKKFGVYDPNHDWSYATQTSVTVNTTESVDVKILAHVNGKSYNFGTFLNVTGTKELKVDVPKGVDELYVQANGKTYTTQPGGTVNIASRTWGTPENEGEGHIDLDFRITPQKKIIYTDPIAEFLRETPEEQENFSNDIDYDFYFVSDGTPFIFYPVYWNTSSYHALGIYWLDEEGHFTPKNMKDVYYTKSKELEWSENYGVNKYFPCTHHRANDDTKVDAGYFCEQCGAKIYPYEPILGKITDAYGNEINTNNYYYNGNSVFKLAYTGNASYSTEDADKRTNSSYDIYSANAIRINGLQVTLPEGTRFGFYLKVHHQNSVNPQRFNIYDGVYDTNEPVGTKKDNGTADKVISHVIFSQSLRNRYYGKPGYETFDGNDYKDIYGVDAVNQASIYGMTDDSAGPWSNKEGWFPDDADENAGWSFAAYKALSLGSKNYTFFAFEDWAIQVADLNDVIFMFDDSYIPNKDDEKPAESYPWIIACEDLGANDFDFNDVVFGVSSPTIKYGDGDQSDKIVSKTVTVYPLAAGGTLPIYLHYKDENGQDKPVSADGSEVEFHSLFNGTHMSNEVINARVGKLTGAKPITINVAPEWSLVGEGHDKDHPVYNENDYRNGHMGGFYVVVKNKPGSDQEYRNIVAPSLDNKDNAVGDAPQMICVPSTWYWPIEMQPIDEVYKDFANWAKYPTNETYKKWHQFKEEHRGLVVEHKNSVPGGSTGSNPGTDPGGDEDVAKVPTFELSSSLIDFDVQETAQICVKDKSDLDGILITDISYEEEGIVDVTSAGFVIPRSAGKTTINFTTQEIKDKYTAATGSLEIEVKSDYSGDDDEFKDGAIDPIFSLTKDRIAIGETSQIQVGGRGWLNGIVLGFNSITPNGVVSVTSNGEITALSKGTATIDFWTNGVPDKYKGAYGQKLTITVYDENDDDDDDSDNIIDNQDGTYTVKPNNTEDNYKGWGGFYCSYDFTNLPGLSDATNIEISFSSIVSKNIGDSYEKGGEGNFSNSKSDLTFILSDDNLETIKNSKVIHIVYWGQYDGPITVKVNK